MQELSCFECAAEGPLHDHHVVPRSRGGTKTVALCEACHGLVHGRSKMTSGVLVSEAMRRKRAKLEYTGGHVRFGYRVAADGQKLELNPTEQAIIFTARQLRQRGLSLRGVASELAAYGMTARSGRAFNPKVVRGLVTGEPPAPGIVAFL